MSVLPGILCLGLVGVSCVGSALSGISSIHRNDMMKPDPVVVGATRFKLRRAQQHLQTLNSGVQGFLDREPYAVLGEFNDDRTKHVHKFIEMEKPPVEWGVLIGEFAYNLRAALDQSIYHLTLSHEGAKLDRIGFPIYLRKEDFFACSRKTEKLSSRSGLWRIRGTSPTIQTLVEGLQPYNDPDPAGTPLAVLNRLGNQDKHNVPVLTAATFMEGGISISPPHPGNSRLHAGPTKHGSLVTEYDFISPAPRQVKVRGEFRFEVVLDGFGEVPAVKLLTDIYATAKHILNSLLMRVEN